MGQGSWDLSPSRSHFGREIPKNRKSPLRLHVVMSADGALELMDAISVAVTRQKPSTIVVHCTIPDTRNHTGGIIWYKELRVLIPPVDHRGKSTFEETDSIGSVHLARDDEPAFRSVCLGIAEGSYDIKVRFGDSFDIWLWGRGLP